MYDRGEVACHFCFNDKELCDWIKEESICRGKCPWCGRRGHLIYLKKLAEPFREVVEALYIQADGPDAADRGERIGDLLDYQWQLFSEALIDLRQELTVSILTADLREKELCDYPHYEGLFFSRELSLEEEWDAKAYAILTGEKCQNGPILELIGEQEEPFGQFEAAFGDLAEFFEPNKQGSLYRARLYDDRHHKEKYTAAEVGAPPPDKTKAGRANQAKQPVLYLASNKSTALAEVRPWKGAAVAVAEIKIKRPLLLVDLSQVQRVKSPFFTEHLQWDIELANLLYRLGQDMSRPVMPHEQEVMYKPTQLLALMIQSARHDGCIYPSAMGSGKNYVLFDTDAVDVVNIEHLRVNSATFFSRPFSLCEEIYEEGPYDHMLKRD
jgi:NTP pyrophosphatase (non-canonical NTP hydrolase)